MVSRGAPLTERAIGVMAEAARGNLVRIPLVNGYALWTCGNYGTVNATAIRLLDKEYIEISPVPCWWPATRVDPRLRGRLKFPDGRVELSTITQAGWAAVRRQCTSADTHRMLGPCPPLPVPGVPA